MSQVSRERIEELMATKRRDVADNHKANQLLVVKDARSPRMNHGDEARSCRWRAALGKEAMSSVAENQFREVEGDPGRL